MSEDNKSRTERIPVPSQGGDKPKEAATPKLKGDYDRLVLGKVFSDPRTIFSVPTPRVSDLQKDAIFVLDTNALLAPFRMGAGQADDIAKVYRRFANDGRLLVPSRAVQEFARNRPKMLSDMFDDLHNRKSNLGRVDTTQCPILEGRSVHDTLTAASEAFQAARKAYSEALDAVMTEVRDWSWDDVISKLYSELFKQDRIIDHDLEPAALLADLERRSVHNIPPGYKDKSKDDGGIGDLLIWHSILKLGKDRKGNVLFVCNEEKADWVLQRHDKTIAVRPELPYEFYSETGFHFGLVYFSDFLKIGKADPKTVEIAKGVEKLAVASEAATKARELDASYVLTSEHLRLESSEVLALIRNLNNARSSSDLGAIPQIDFLRVLSTISSLSSELMEITPVPEERRFAQSISEASTTVHRGLFSYKLTNMPPDALVTLKKDASRLANLLAFWLAM